jgi:glycerophosphoryl diester phosphodiesterase
MANQNETNNKDQGILTRLRRNKWMRRLTRTALILVVVIGLLIVFASNRFFYLSHQRFSNWCLIQWKYQLDSNANRSSLLIIGHRGSGIKSIDSDADVDNKLIGNTIIAINAAIDAKVDWIEIDIRKSKDGVLVVFHDSNVSAKTDFDPNVPHWRDSTGEVSDLTLSQLKSLNLHVPSNRKILTLDEMFASTEIPSGTIRWIFDIKESGISHMVLDWLEKKNIPQDQLILFGDYEVFGDYEMVQKFKGSGYPLGYTTLYTKSRDKMLFKPSEMFDRCDELGCKLMVVPIFFLTTTLIDSASDRGIDVWCYDSNDVRDLRYASGCGVKGVIGDYPKELMNEFKDLDKGSQPSVH